MGDERLTIGRAGMSDETFTLYWRMGKREVVKGETIAKAMTLAGYSGGAVAALDFFVNGEDHDWEWRDRDWHRIRTGDQG